MTEQLAGGSLMLKHSMEKKKKPRDLQEGATHAQRGVRNEGPKTSGEENLRTFGNRGGGGRANGLGKEGQNDF